MKTKTSFNDFRFKGFHYKSCSPKYWVFEQQINDDETKVLVRIAAVNVFSYTTNDLKTGYVLKLDRTHCIFLKSWQYFKGHYGNYVLFDKDHFHVSKSRNEFKELPVHGKMLSFASAIYIAKKQQIDQPDLTILIRKN